MAVSKPLEKKPKVDVETLIDKGARVKEDNIENDEKKWTNLNLRIPTAMVKQIDEALKERVGIVRTGWILEAIHEKLKKEI